MSTQPTERDLSYRAQQRAASTKVRGQIYARSGITPEAAPRRFRRALSAMARHRVPFGVTVKAAARLLSCDPLTARDFLARCGGLVTLRKRPRVVAFNYTPGEGTAEDGTITINRPARNAAKAQRRARACA